MARLSLSETTRSAVLWDSLSRCSYDNCVRVGRARTEPGHTDDAIRVQGKDFSGWHRPRRYWLKLSVLWIFARNDCFTDRLKYWVTKITESKMPISFWLKARKMICHLLRGMLNFLADIASFYFCWPTVHERGKTRELYSRLNICLRLILG